MHEHIGDTFVIAISAIGGLISCLFLKAPSMPDADLHRFLFGLLCAVFYAIVGWLIKKSLDAFCPNLVLRFKKFIERCKGK